jgi:hypothetical protein
MIQLDSGNVLLKPSLRRQLMARLKRSLKLGERIGNFLLKIRINRVGRAFEVRADVHDSAGNFDFRSRRSDLRSALRDLIRSLAQRLRLQQLKLATG